MADSISKNTTGMSVRRSSRVCSSPSVYSFQIKTCLCRGRPKGLAAPARAQLPPLSIWPQPCGPGGAASDPCCSSGTPAGPPGKSDKDLTARKDQRCQLPNTRVSAGEERRWAGRNDASLSTLKPGHATATGSCGARPRWAHLC